MALLLMIGAAIVLCAIWLYVNVDAILFPADILTWSESDFVNDIIKFRIGYPLYTDQRNNDSFVYPPGAQLLTYAISVLIGKSQSIPAYRLIRTVAALAAAGAGS
ncbi:MAG: hypothetical protein NZM33_11765 [Bryobacteraceae bacterium]|nr:hypothetical protein [Bryobacteraceae bacterium]